MNMFAVLGLLLIVVIITALVVTYLAKKEESKCACDNESKLATASPTSGMLREDPAIVKPDAPLRPKPGGRPTGSNVSAARSSRPATRANVSAVSSGKSASLGTARSRISAR